MITSAEVGIVISGKEGAYALERAKRAGVRTAVVQKKDCASQEEFEDRISAHIDEAGAEIIVLAGFMSILSERFTSRYEGAGY